MKQILRYGTSTILIVVFMIVSCQKELDCYDCETNKVPIANAGIDQKIRVPQDSVLLNGNASGDEDGIIAKWLWTKISGPASFNLVKPNEAATMVTNLTKGVYSFQLTVTDDKGASAKDTVTILVETPSANQPPVACAGADQSMMLPTNSVILSASCSTDPDNDLEKYQWTNISGPSSAVLTNANAVSTQVTGLLQGVYHFEVKVTDTGGLFSTDTVKVTINAATVVANCGETNRPVVSARLISIAQLSEPSTGMAVASAGNKILFMGASVAGNPPGYGSDNVHIFDISTQAWSAAKLSASRADVAAVAAGNKIFIAGGRLGNQGGYSYYSTVDIYDAVTNSWSVSKLSQARAYIAAASVGDKVIFAGGEQEWPKPVSDRVDIYNLSTNSWSERSLSVPRNGITAVAVNNQIFFAGGSNHLGGISNVSKVIDVYDNATNSWSVTSLSEPKAFFAGINVANKIYWAGGDDESGKPSCKVEIRDLNTQTSSQAFLFHPFNYSITEGQNAVVKDHNIIWFATLDPLNGIDTDKFNIYNTITKTWSIGLLPYKMSGASVISVNNTVYVAGGYINGKMSEKVWKLDL